MFVNDGLSFAEWCAVVRFRNVERSLKIPPGCSYINNKNAAKARSTVVNLVGARFATVLLTNSSSDPAKG
jgi:hypothetical protein